MEKNQQKQSLRAPSSQGSSERDPSERAEQPYAKRIGRILIWFVVAMVALTFLSRAASDALKAKVSVGYTNAGSLDLSVSGSGKWVSGETQFFTTYFARRISKVFVKPGQAVTEGDSLFAYDVSTVTGGKKAPSRAPAMSVSRLAWVWSTATRIRRASAKAAAQPASVALR